MERTTTLVAVIPALNEEASIANVVERIPREIPGIDLVKVVVVDDGSSDRTAEIASEKGAEVVRHGHNLGLGRAFLSGLDAALKLKADIIVNLDGDGQFSPEDIPQLIAPIRDQNYGFVTCTRFGNPEFIPHMPWIKKIGNYGMCYLINAIIGTRHRFTDVSCGFRAYSRETALQLTLFGRFTYTQETFIDLAFKGIPMTEVPLRVRGVREFGKSRVASNLWKYAFSTLPIILRALRDCRPLAFFGIPSLLFMAAGLGQLLFVTQWWLSTGFTRPWTSLITLGGTFLTLGLLVGVVALLADQLGRVRRSQEQLLYFARRDYYDQVVE